jgi:hypothetical protein
MKTGLGAAGVSLVQLFERRVVIYTPDLPTAERFTLASSGRHYYRWRYGTDPGAPQESKSRSLVPPVTGRSDREDLGLTLPEGFSATALDIDAVGIVDVAVTPAGLLALAADDGTIRVEGRPRTDRPLVDGLDQPIRIAFSGKHLYAVDAAGLHQFSDDDSDGQIDREATLIATGFEPTSVSVTPGPDGSVYLSGTPIAASRGGQSTSQAVTGPDLLHVMADGEVRHVTTDTNSPVAIYADGEGMVWTIDRSGRLWSIDPLTDQAAALFETGTVSGEATIADLLAYRADGANGNPERDLLALVTGDGSSRVVRLELADRSGTATPPTGQRGTTGAVIDYITGLDRPAAMASGLDGSLYILDAGTDRIIRVAPE